MRVSLDDTDNDDDGRALYDGRPLTGVAVESLPDGTVLAETSFRDGIQDGPERAYHRDGQLRAEKVYRSGLVTESREWHPNGKLARLSRYELGRKVEEHFWDENSVESAD